jgi:UDP-GlcNAc:undecaprenyl-phosphate/decaprenyl-phosphate GlcNAc-1-phosphate transferase
MTLYFSQAVSLLEIIVAGIAAAVVFCPLAIWVANHTRLIDYPGAAAHKQHARPTPLAGGIALAISMVALLTIFHLWQKPFSSLIAAAAIIFVFGLWDDARGLSALQKMVGQVLASIVLIASGVSVDILSEVSIPFINPVIIETLELVITIFWIVGISNSINLIDSMDGLALGYTGIAFAFLLGMTLVAQQNDLARFCGILLGISIGLYVFNISPARLFLGDSGAQTMGFILASVAILYTPHGFPQASSWFVPIMVLGMPIFDTTLVVVSRLRQRRPVFQADRSHVYHRLVAMGLDPNRAVLAVHGTSLLLNFLAFIALYLIPWQANLVFAVVVAVGIVLIVFLERKSTIPDDFQV